MNYEELRRYIRDLQQSGFDVVRLRVQLYEKFAFPLITLVMAVLAGSFLLFTGQSGGPAGGGGGGGEVAGFTPPIFALFLFSERGTTPTPILASAPRPTIL